jgi:ATP-binding cassette, subfamily B, bacterial
MLTDIFHAKELRLFNLGDTFRQRYRDLRTVYAASAWSWRKNAPQPICWPRPWPLYLSSAWLPISPGRPFWVITLGSLVMYQQAFQRAQAALQGIMSGLAGLYEAKLFLNHFYGFLDLKPQVTAAAKPPGHTPPDARRHCSRKGIF